MWHLRDPFVVGTDMVLICEVDIAVGCVLAHVWKIVKSI